MKIILSMLLILVAMKIRAQDSNLYQLDSTILLSPDTVSYTYYGKTVHDPYRFLEDLEDSTNQQWYQDENQFSRSVLDQIPKQKILRTLSDFFLADSLRASIPEQRGNRLFYIQNNKQQKTESLILQDKLDGTKIVLFDTHQLNEKYQTHHTIDYQNPSTSGRLVALGISAKGSEQSTIYVLDTDSGELLNDSLPRAMYGNPTWLHDESGFFFNQFQPSGEAVVNLSQSQVWLHRIGNPNNQLIFSYNNNSELPLAEIDFPFAELFPNSDQLFVYVYRGTSRYVSLYSTSLTGVLNSPSVVWHQWVDQEDQVTDFSMFHDSLVLLTFRNAPFGKIVKLNTSSHDSDAPSPKVIVSEDELLIEDIHIVLDKLYINRRIEGGNQLTIVSLSNQQEKEIKLPVLSAVEFPRTRYNSTDTIFFKIESWNIPETIVVHTGFHDSVTITKLQQLRYPGIDSIEFRVVEVPSHDGEMVPMTLIYNKYKIADKPLPTFLTAYGAYGYADPPRISDYFYNWAKDYGVMAIAHVRGGGYRGEAWHKAGYKSTKHNSWKDVIACAEYLIKKNYTTLGRLVLSGSSAGGLTAGRVLTERPDLFNAVFLMVPITNPLRFETSFNKANIQEFGTVENPEEFEALLKMDPYTHLKPNVEYPPTLFTAAANDARLPMWQPGKMVARMQEYLGNEVPVLFRINYEGGHFGSDSEERKAEVADVLSFFLWQLGHPDFQPDTKESPTVRSGE